MTLFYELKSALITVALFIRSLIITLLVEKLKVSLLSFIVVTVAFTYFLALKEIQV